MSAPVVVAAARSKVSIVTPDAGGGKAVDAAARVLLRRGEDQRARTGGAEARRPSTLNPR